MSINPAHLSRKTISQQEELSPQATLVRNALIEHGLETPMIKTGFRIDWGPSPAAR